MPYNLSTIVDGKRLALFPVQSAEVGEDIVIAVTFIQGAEVGENIGSIR